MPKRAVMLAAGGLIAGLMAPACTSRAGADSGLEARIDSVNGLPRLVYPGEGGILLPWRADTTARIGDVLGDDDAYQFDRVQRTGLAGDSRGNIYVLDGAGSRILSYDAGGNHRATVGRAGEGPGELASPFALATGAGDTIWVLDPLNTRVTGFPPDSSEPRVVTFAGMGGFPTGSFAIKAGFFLMQSSPPIRLAGGGSVRFGGGGVRIGGGGARGGARAAAPTTVRRGGPPVSADPDSTVDRRVPVFRVAPDGQAAVTLWHHTPPEVKPVQLNTGGDRVMIMAAAPSFTPVLRWAAFADGGIVVSETDRYELNVIGPDGKPRFQIVREMAPWPVTETEKEHAREQLRNSRTSFGGNASIDMKAIIEQQIANMTFAETVPRIAGLAIDAKDRIWVGVALTTPGTVDRVDIYDRDGKFLGSLENVKVPDVFLTDNRGASLVRDADTDVQQVAVYRIVEGGR
jgi:hypothetical protein